MANPGNRPATWSISPDEISAANPPGRAGPTYCPECGYWSCGASQHPRLELPARLWLYTNFDCNQACRYCVVSSSPRAAQRALGRDRPLRLLDEACALRIQEVFFTGGEPFLLPDADQLIKAATPHFLTTVLTNATAVHEKRLDRLRRVNHPNLRLQVSLDAAEPGPHDQYRGRGTWQRTVVGIQRLLDAGIQVRIGTTVTSAGLEQGAALRAFSRDRFCLEDADLVVRPLVRRGAATAGMEIERDGLLPEITVTDGGVYWHPAAPDDDFLVSRDIFPLGQAVKRVIERLTTAQCGSGRPYR